MKRPKILIFDEATSNLDQETAEHFAKTINQLKGKVTMLFITHGVPKGLRVDQVINIANTIPHGVAEKQQVHMRITPEILTGANTK